MLSVEKELENFLKSPMAQDPSKVKDIKKAVRGVIQANKFLIFL